VLQRIQNQFAKTNIFCRIYIIPYKTMATGKTDVIHAKIPEKAILKGL